MRSTFTIPSSLVLVGLFAATLALPSFENGQDQVLAVDSGSHLNIDSEVNAIEKDSTVDVVIPKGLEIKEAISTLNSSLSNSTGLTNETFVNASTSSANASTTAHSGNASHGTSHETASTNSGIMAGLTCLAIAPIALLLL